MNTRKIIQGALFLAAVCVSSVSWAQGGRFYFSAGVGSSKIDTGITGLTGTAKLDDTDTGFRLTLGYQLNRNIGFEGFYSRYGTAAISGNTGDRFQFDGTTYQFLTTAKIKLDTSAIGIGGVFTLPLAEAFDVHARAGMASWRVDASSGSSLSNLNGTDIYYGAGARYDFNKSAAVSLDYEQSKLSKGLKNATMVSANLIVKY